MFQLKNLSHLFSLQMLSIALLGFASNTFAAIQQVSAGGLYTCAIKADQALSCFGSNENGNVLPPAGTFISVASGHGLGSPSCAIRTDKTLACWGHPINEPPPVSPEGNFRQVFPGVHFACAIRLGGELLCWPLQNFPSVDYPKESFKDVGVGMNFACGIKSNGTIICWGPDNTYGQKTPPLGKFNSISTFASHSCAIRDDRKIVCWGRNLSGETSPPNGDFAFVAIGFQHACALKANGTPICWGNNADGQSSPPTTLNSYRSLTTGAFHTCGIQADGYVLCWGSNSDGQLGLPPVLTAKNAMGKVGQLFFYKVFAKAYPDITHYQVSQGELPPGLIFDEQTGVLSGTPVKAGIYETGIIASNDVHTPDGKMVQIEIVE